MTTIHSEHVQGTIEEGDIELKIFPYTSPSNPAASNLYEIAVRVVDHEFGRVGVWKDATGGVEGDGAPHVRVVGTQVEVAAGDGMNGSFDIDCEFENQAEELAKLLDQLLTDKFNQIEVEITDSE